MPEFRERRIPPAGFGPTLRAARERAGLGLREAARQVRVSHSYMAALEAGSRCPSVTMTRRLVEVLALGEAERAAVLAGAVDDAGLDHPLRRRRDGLLGVQEREG